MNKELVTYKDTKLPISEMFRTLETNLESAYINEELKTILITSVLHGEGKSFVASNLAITYANAGKKVLLIDGDISNGDQYSKFEVQLSHGLSNYLKDSGKTNNIKEFIQETEIQNLSIMTSGDHMQNSSELFVSKQLSNLIDELKKEYDIIVFDSTPSLLETEAVILSRLVDATIIVTSDKKVKVNDINKVKDIIEDVGGKIAGIILNKVSMSKKEYNNIKITIDNEEDNENNVEVEKKEIEVEEIIGFSEEKAEKSSNDEKINVFEKQPNKDKKLNSVESNNEKIDILDKEIINEKENPKEVKKIGIKKEVKKKKSTTKKATNKTTKKATNKTTNKNTKKVETKAKDLNDAKEKKKKKSKQPDRSKDILKQINKYLDNQ